MMEYVILSRKDFSGLREGRRMRFYITMDSGGMLTISDDDDSFISLRVSEKEADILSFIVPQEKRRRGIGTGLLKTAEKILQERGIFFIYANPLCSIEGMRELLVKNKYDVMEGTGIIDIKNVLGDGNPVLEKLMKQDVNGLTPFHLDDLDINKWNELLDYLVEHGVHMTCFDLAFLDQHISTVIYDKEDRICSLILSSIRENNIYLELLLSSAGTENKYYTFAALKCIITDIIRLLKKRDYRKVLFPACNPGISAFIENNIHAGEDRILREPSLEAYKITYNLSYKDVDPPAIAIDESTEAIWMRALARNPLQHIISWKIPWYRAYQKHEKT